MQRIRTTIARLVLAGFAALALAACSSATCGNPSRTGATGNLNDQYTPEPNN